MKKVAIVGASGYSGEELVRLLLHHPHAELAAVTSRQYAGQTLAQVFPKFANHPKRQNAALQRAESRSRCRQAGARLFFSRCRTASRRNTPCPCSSGLQVIDLSADFRLKSAAVYKEFYAHDHPAPDLLAKSVYGLPEIYRAEIKKAHAHRVAGLLSHQHFAAHDSVAESGTDQIDRHHRRFAERRQRRGPEGGTGLSVRRMQRKRAALRRAQAPASFGDRTGTFARGGSAGHAFSSRRI